MLKKKTNTKKVIITVSVLALIGLIVGSWFGYRYYQSNKSGSEQTNTSQTNVDSTDAQNNSTNTNTDPSTTDTQPGAQTTSNIPVPSKPVLIKSSGNNGSVPSGAIIEFVCQGTAGLSCKVVLINQGGGTVELPIQALKDNGRGQYFTSWEWKSTAGLWQVYAVATNSQGGSAEGDKQKLEVR